MQINSLQDALTTVVRSHERHNDDGTIRVICELRDTTGAGVQYISVRFVDAEGYQLKHSHVVFASADAAAEAFSAMESAVPGDEPSWESLGAIEVRRCLSNPMPPGAEHL